MPVASQQAQRAAWLAHYDHAEALLVDDLADGLEALYRWIAGRLGVSLVASVLEPVPDPSVVWEGVTAGVLPQLDQVADRSLELASHLFDVTVDSRFTASFAAQRRARLLEVGQTARARVAEQVRRGLLLGEGTDKIAARVAGTLDPEAARRHAVTVARTEVTDVSNEASLRVMMLAGFERKRWLASGDIRVRDSHAALDEATVAVASWWSTPDGRLRWPGDRGLGCRASGTANCRCTMVSE